MEPEQPISPPPDKPVTITFPNQTTASKVVDFIVRKKPVGWGRRSFATYYKEVYALWLKKEIDLIMVDRKPRIFRYDAWPKVSKTSLYLRINQATAYLLEQLDSDGMYKKFFETVRIKREPLGIVIKFDEVLEGAPAAEVIADNDIPTWKKKLDNYLDDPSIEEPFHIDKLLLSDKQIQQLDAELSGLSNVIYTITSREVKVIKS